MTTTPSTHFYATCALIGRILLAMIFLVSVWGKLAAPAATQGYIASVGMPLPVLAYAFAVIVELCGGLMLLLGWRVRVAAPVFAVYSVVTAIAFHGALGDQNQLYNFLKNLAIAGGMLQVMAFGAGSLSLDNRRAGSKAPGYAA